MKKIISLVLCFGSVLSIHAASQDFSKGIDMTARTSVSASALNQLIDSAYPATNRGLTIVTNGAPNVTADPKLVRYIWLDTSFNPPAIKTYNTNTLAWESAAIGVGSVGTIQLADAAVSTVKIANSAVDNSKLANDSVTSVKIVDGTIAAADLGANSVTRDKIYPGAVGPGQLTNSIIFNTNLTAGIIYNSNLTANSVFGTNIAANTIVNSNLTANSIESSNIIAGTIQGTNIAGNTINYTNCYTNLTMLIPRWVIMCQTNGTINYQVVAPGSSACSIAAGVVGQYTLTFGNTMASTNYVINVNTFTLTGGSPCYATLTNSSTASTGITVNDDTGAGRFRQMMITVWGL